MKTAVEWLVEHLTEYGVDLSHHELEIEQANKMFEEQIKEAWFDGVTNWDSEKEVEDYLNETFKSE
jgi:hypothetical protein